MVNKQKLEKAEAKSREKAEKKLISEANKKAAPKALINDSGTVNTEYAFMNLTKTVFC